MLLPAIKALRPHQWVKNLFVAAPLIFARRIDDSQALIHTAMAAVAFCLLSSSVYLANDLFDIEKDRAHPVKRTRPIASGALSLRAAQVLAAVIALSGIGLALNLGVVFLSIGVAYLALNLAYSLALKKVAFVDVACLSVFFLLRVLAGSVAIPVHPSRWLLGCTLLLSALLGFGKRAHELRVSGESGSAQRDVLGKYDPATLTRLLFLLGTLTAVAYLAYTRSTHARSLFGEKPLFITVPFVAFGIFRFITLAIRKTDAESPTDSMLRDIPFVINLVLYAGAILYLVWP